MPFLKQFLSSTGAALLLVAGLFPVNLAAQAPTSVQTDFSAIHGLHPVPQVDRVSSSANLSVKVPLTGHLPAWATANREIAGQSIQASTPWRVSITLQRDPGVQAAFEQLLADQQKPGSPMYHHWLTATEIGQLYGPTQHDVDALVHWLTSQGLTIVNVAPSRMLVDADGTIGTVSAAFQTTFSSYKLGGAERRAARTEPLVPAALAPVIGSIGGLAEMLAEPQSHGQELEDANLQKNGINEGRPLPQYTSSSNAHYLVAGDFDTIYDINSVVRGGNTGATIGSVTNANCPVPTGQCIAIIGRSRVTTADITTYMSRFGANGQTSYNLTQTAVPSASGGADPGITYDSDYGEATLDVQRVVGTANGAQAVLLVSGNVNGQDGTNIAESYNVNTLMYPVMTISFGLCEAQEGPAYQSASMALFAQAAAEGISTFVSSGDSGAAGCDTSFAQAPATQALGINFLCASPYVTCVGGTEFNDASAASTYWNSTNNSDGTSVKSYIPEGAWNEPGSSGTQVASTGGGPSNYATKPSFQTGVGVPQDGYRDTPDVAFSAAQHDGYYQVQTPSSGATQKYYFYAGTSAAAPGMAAIAALLNTNQGFQAGNLNPLIYQLAATNPSVFNDVTVASSGVTNCTTATPSLCNNSTPGPSSLNGGLAGYAVTAGYDLATGWGSLDVAKFLNAAAAANLTVSSSHLSNFLAGSTGNTYTLTVTNTGATASSGTISVTDLLPSGFNATGLSGSGWTCTVATLTCTESAPLAANTSASPISLTVSVSSSDSGSYVNSVSVSVGGTPGGSGTDPTIVGSLLPPALTMSFSPAGIAVNQSSTLTYTLSNPNSAASGSTLNGVAFSQVNPVNLTFTGYRSSCTSGSYIGTLNAYTNSNYVSGATLAPGGSCIVYATVAPTAGRYVVGSSTVTSTNGGTGAAATATLTVGAQLSATSSHRGNFTAGDPADTYTLTVASNSASGAATSGTVTATDTLPSGFTATALSGSGWTCTLSSVSCTRSDALAIGASYPPITLTVRISATDAGVYYNTVTVSGGASFSLAPGSDTTTVGNPPTATETFSPATVTPNTVSTLTITLGNPAGNPMTLTGVAFSDNLPPGLTISTPSGAATSCSGANLTAVAQGSSFSLAGASLAPGATCTVNVNVFSAANGSYTNATGMITSANNPASPGTSATLTVFSTPTQVVFTKAPPPTIAAGGNAGLVTATLEDAMGNVATTSNINIGLQVTGPSGYNYLAGYLAPTNGAVTFDLSGLQLTVSGVYSYRAIPAPGSPPAVTTTATVTPGAASAFSVTGLSTFTAPGMSGTATVRAVDSYGNVATGFTGTVTLTSTDPQVVFTPSSYTFAAADAGSHSVTVTFNTAGSQTVTAASGSLTGSETGILVEDAIWVLNTDATLARLTTAGVQTTSAGTASGTSAYGAVAIDNAGDVWTVSQTVNAVQAYTKAGAALPVPGSAAAGVTAPVSLFVDGLGQVWVANGNNSVSVLTNAGAAVSPSTGYTAGGNMYSAPSGITVDFSGNVWVTNSGNNTLTEILGAAGPAAPLSTAVANVTTGARP